jgi:hypothetical protein
MTLTSKETGLGITTKNLRVGLADLIAIPTVLALDLAATPAPPIPVNWVSVEVMLTS